VKVPEKFGFNWSIFGWFGHFTEHVACGELGFLGNGHLRSENPPEGARILQGYKMGIIEHIPPLGFTGFDKNSKGFGIGANGEYKRASAHRTEREENMAAHRGGKERGPR
jgi:hypothetical protein